MDVYIHIYIYISLPSNGCTFSSSDLKFPLPLPSCSCPEVGLNKRSKHRSIKKRLHLSVYPLLLLPYREAS